MDVKQLANYYQTITATAHMKRVSFDSAYSVLDSTDFETRGKLEGIISGKLTPAALRQVKKDLRIRGGKIVNVLIVPKALQPLGDNAKSSGEAALVIPAKLNGVFLSPNTENEKPYVPRDFLQEEPAPFMGLDAQAHLGHSREISDDNPYYLGTFKSYQTYATSPKTKLFWNNLDQEHISQQWKLYVEHALAMFDQIVDPAMLADAASPFELFDDAFFIVEGSLQNPAAPISELYHAIAKHSQKPELQLFRALPDALHNTQTLSTTLPQGITSAQEHCGAMENKFCLAESQRQAVHYSALQRPGQVLAVSGPPGTGKTALLKGLIADLMVKHALAGLPAPLIVGTSTNNQAVTNIIESFAGIGNPNDTNPLYCRWLPDIEPADDTSDEDGPTYADRPLHSLGVFMPATSKRKAAAEKNYLIDNFPTRSGGLYAHCTTNDYLKLANARLIRLAHQALGLEFANVEDVCCQLQGFLGLVDSKRQELLGLAQYYVENPAARVAILPEIATLVETFNNLGALNAKGEGINLTKLVSSTPESFVSALDEMLDTTVRPFEFWLALHYFECQWLLTGDRLSEEELSKRTQDCFERYWKLLPNLTPLVVMTMFRLPLVFKYLSDTHKTDATSFGFGRIDLLIVDEAGQVDTAIGAAALALAKRAVIVGDVSQLPPVWNVSEVADTLIAQNPLDLNTSLDWQKLQVAGLTASQPSSLMRAAQAACPWSYHYRADGKIHTEGGLFLSEHRRCKNEIIKYCNDLLYHGLLKPKRNPNEKPEYPGTPYIELPPMGYVATTGSARQLGTSRVNEEEAEAIARWLYENYPAIRAQYPKTVAKAGAEKNKGVVGIVTPFKAQAKLIRKKLSDPKYSFVPLEPEPTPDASNTQIAPQGDSPQTPATPIKLAQEITVGTAHTLQGAERPVMLFSLVYAGSTNPAFVESNKELMNVAVSRAKDSFITFGDKNLLSHATGNVLRLLWNNCGEHGCANPEKRCAPAKPLRSTDPAAALGNPAAPSNNPAVLPFMPTIRLEFRVEENMVLSRILPLMQEHYPYIQAWLQSDRPQKLKWAKLRTWNDVQFMNIVFKHAGLLTKPQNSWVPTFKGVRIGIKLVHEKDYDKVVYTERATAWIVEHFQEIVEDIPLD